MSGNLATQSPFMIQTEKREQLYQETLYPHSTLLELIPVSWGLFVWVATTSANGDMASLCRHELTQHPCVLHGIFWYRQQQPLHMVTWLPPILISWKIPFLKSLIFDEHRHAAGTHMVWKHIYILSKVITRPNLIDSMNS